VCYDAAVPIVFTLRICVKQTAQPLQSDLSECIVTRPRDGRSRIASSKSGRDNRFFSFLQGPEGVRGAQQLRQCATDRNVEGSIPDGFIVIFH
jgi:hypothetical protein